MTRVVALALLWSAFASAKKPDPRQEGRAHFAQGKSFQDAGAYDDAIREYQAAYQLTPLPLLLFNIGQSYRLKGDKKTAVDYYEKYLTADPNGPAGDEARDQIANLKLKLQLEEAELARKKSAEEAAEATRRATEAEAARLRAVQDEALRRKSVVEEEARLRLLAQEMEQASAKKRSEEAEAKRLRIQAAGRVGRPYTISGAVGIVLGIALAGGFVWIAVKDGSDHKNNLDHVTSWTTQNDAELQQELTDSHAMIGCWSAGGALIVSGIALTITGARLHSNAVDKASY